MKKLALVPMPHVESLPKWNTPKNLGEAAIKISELGRDMHEHAYLVGRTLLWVKGEVGRGKFDDWVKINVWFNRTTAYAMMKFAKRCERVGRTIEYHPNRSTVERSPNKKRKSDLRPPESILFFDIAHRIEESFSSLTQEQKRDFVETMQDLIRQLKTRIEESAQ